MTTHIHSPPTPKNTKLNQEGDAQADPELNSLLQQLDNGEGGAEVIEAIQEKFLQRTLGGA